MGFSFNAQPTVPCPKCKRPLPPSGELSVAGMDIPTYECPECVRIVDFCGEKMEVSLAFVLSKDGRPVDPADLDADLTK